MGFFRARHLLGLSAAALITGCATTPPEATVQVFTGPVQYAPGTTYRHERLPSQVAQARQVELEAAAEAVLSQAGLRRDDVAPQLLLRVIATQDPVAYRPFWGGGSSVGIGISGGGHGGGVGVGLGIPIGGGGGAVAGSQRVDVQLRDVVSGQVVFQSLASGDARVSAVSLLQVALGGFPNAAPGRRQVPLAWAPAR